MFDVVARALDNASMLPPDFEVDRADGLEIIYRPIRDILTAQKNNLIKAIHCLGALEEYFGKKFQPWNTVNWNVRIDDAANIYHCLMTMDVQDLAKFYIEKDLDLFNSLSLDSVYNAKPEFRYLHATWNDRCLATQDCLLVDPSLTRKVSDIAQACSPTSYAISIV